MDPGRPAGLDPTFSVPRLTLHLSSAPTTTLADQAYVGSSEGDGGAVRCQ
ncbi:MAG: hypothetical protein QOD57_1058 [Actinomycetota bacterium]|jgi:hypothetical protein|nr:hypothetical protein [Actinomycetota bacterium]